MSKITCVGCGLMGGNIIDAFINCGHDVTIVDINREAAQSRVSRGARFTTKLAEALDSRFILFNLPDDNGVRSVLSSCPKGSLSDRIFVNTTSEVPSDVLDVERVVKRRGGHYIDSTILTYQGEVGSKHGCLLYSGDGDAYAQIEPDLCALSNPPIYLGGETSVAAEIVDLVVVTSHFGFSYTPLEGIAKCAEYGIDVDDYLRQMVELLPRLTQRPTCGMSSNEVTAASEEQVFTKLVSEMVDNDLFDRFNAEWLQSTNKCVANHYGKMLNIARTNFQY